MGEGDKDSLREFYVIGALQICLCLWFLEPERLRVLRLRRCHSIRNVPCDTLSHRSERRGEIYRKVRSMTNEARKRHGVQVHFATHMIPDLSGGRVIRLRYLIASGVLGFV